jgi:hypothetical protein
MPGENWLTVPLAIDIEVTLVFTSIQTLVVGPVIDIDAAASELPLTL